MKNIQELIMENESPNLLDENNEPIWATLIKKHDYESISLLINNGLDVSLKNKSEDSWLILCALNKIPNYILIMGLNSYDPNWFKPNKYGFSPFFYKELEPYYAEIMGKKIWTDGLSWNSIFTENQQCPLDFFKDNDNIKIYNIFKYWKKLTIRR